MDIEKFKGLGTSIIKFPISRRGLLTIVGAGAALWAADRLEGYGKMPAKPTQEQLKQFPEATLKIGAVAVKQGAHVYLDPLHRATTVQEGFSAQPSEVGYSDKIDLRAPQNFQWFLFSATKQIQEKLATPVDTDVLWIPRLSTNYK